MSAIKIYNATELWQRESGSPSIPSFSLALDNALGNDGIQLGSMTELIGLPGSGKTQLCLQFCASVQIPKILGGLSAEALFVDTNTNFNIHRFKEILFASLSKCQSLLDTSIAVQEEDALKKIHYINAIGLEKFCASIKQLPKLIQEHPNIKLIAIDSIAFPFKEGISAKQRTGLLFRLMADLQRLAMEQQIAVVLTNEMSTRVGLSCGAVVGALGDAWAHRCGRRVLLSGAGAARAALLLKSNDAPTAVARFKITEDGIRDID
ncbi:DNA repair protein RAD51 homolog 3-like isoform X2 [Choristoneura fumiferana]|uniref:DNA repair protein RAD51 homolog 3-like isoform X2 n=1 Tax=Choristoneura fumiferana TaxID=7141 RepID=UPI003D15E6D3